MSGLFTGPGIGADFVGYRIEALLGRGGMSVVYRAEDLRLKRKVALKLLAPELAEDQRFRDRFLRESELAASLDHPNIVPIYDAGEVDGQLYIAMRYVPRGDLKGPLREGIEPGYALKLLGQVASALDAAHARGLVHRDVKPGNVLLDSEEHCYLSDFGLTKQVSSQSGFTATGQIMGTIDYVAPEVIEGKELTASADLYSLGCLLYECLAGEPPFHKESEFAVLWAHVNEPPPKLSERRPELPPELDAVVAKALAKAPERRYQSGRELVEAARAAWPAAAPTLPSPGQKRRLLLVAAVATATLAIVLPLTLMGGGPHGPSTKPTLAVTADSIQRIDPKTNTLAATIAVPVRDFLITAGGGSVWAANADENRLFRIDPKRNTVVQTIQTVDPSALTLGAGSLWVLDASAGVVTQFDPATGAATATVVLPPGVAPGVSTGLRASDEGVWVQWAGRTGNAVRIDPRSTAAKSVTIGTKSVPLVYGFAPVGSVLWALAPDPEDPSVNAVLRVDLRKPGSPPVVIPVAALTYMAIVADRNGVWLSVWSENRVVHINSRTRRVDRRVPVGDRPISIAEGEGAVWVANQGDGTVSRIDPATGRVVATIRVGPNPTGIAVGAGGVWVDVHPR